MLKVLNGLVTIFNGSIPYLGTIKILLGLFVNSYCVQYYIIRRNRRLLFKSIFNRFEKLWLSDSLFIMLKNKN